MQINWQILMDELERSGVKRPAITAACGLSKSSLSELASIPGSVPRGRAAVILYLMHKRKTKGKQTAVTK